MSNSFNGWLNTNLTFQNGCVSSSAGLLNNAVVMDSENAWNFSELFFNPSFKDVITSFFADPSDFIVHLFAYPFNIPIDGSPNNLVVNKTRFSTVKVAKPKFNASLANNTIFTMLYTKINPKYNDFRDYNGYTTIRVYLPLYGFVDVSTNDVMGKYLVIKLGIDFYTATGMYFVCSADGPNVDDADLRILSKHQCRIGVEVPISSTNALDVARNNILSTVKLGTSVAISAATGTLVGPGITTTNERTDETIQEPNPETGRLRTASKYRGTHTIASTTTVNHTKDTANEIASTAFSMLANSVIHCETDKTLFPTLEQWATKVVKIVIERPVYTDMGDYRHYMGSPLFKESGLYGLFGYTEIGSIHLDGIGNITESEKRELENLLHSGVVF